MTQQSDVVIIGGGVIGASTAWRLASRGHDVTLIEQFEPGHDHGSSHGSSRIFRLAYTEGRYVELAQAALQGWRLLEDEADAAVLSLTGAVDHGDPAAIEALRAALQAHGVDHEVLSPGAAHERWPGQRFDGLSLVHADAGRLHADAAVAALLIAARKRGAVVQHGQAVAAIQPVADDRVAVRTEAGDTIEARRVVVSAGAWSAGLVANLGGIGDRLPTLRVTQEQPAHFDVHDADVPWPSFIHRRSELGVYGLGNTGAGGAEGVKIGFHAVGREVDPRPAHRDRRPDDRWRSELSRYAELWLPGVDASSAAPTTCLYTLTPDHHFVIDRVGPVVVAAGFSGHGFKFGPAIGDLVARLALDDHLSTPELFAFGPRQLAGSAA